MARLPRWSAPGQLHQVMQRGVAGTPIFRDAQDYLAFLDALRLAALDHRVAIHAYALLPDAIHLLATPEDGGGLSRTMQSAGRRYVVVHNRRHGRSGTLWDGRFRAAVVEAERHWLACRTYVEALPVRRGLADDAAAYPWSSAAHYGGLRNDPLVSVHPLDWRLGNTPFDREVARKMLHQRGLDPSQTSAIEQAVGKGWALGSDAFLAALEQQAQRRTRPARPGRPRRTGDTQSM